MRYVFVAVVMAFVLCGCSANYSEGTRVGTIQKLSRKGFFCKSWEGTMLVGGVREKMDDKGNTSLSLNVWDFTVEEHNTLEKIQAAMNSGKRMELVYEEKFFTFCRSDSDYFVIDVKEVP